MSEASPKLQKLFENFKKAWPFLALLGIAVLVIIAGRYAIDSVASASENVKAASIAAFVGVLTLLTGRYFEQKRERRQITNSEKIRVYQMFFDIYFGLLKNAKLDETKQEVANDKLIEDIQIFQKELLLWGSDNVVKAWIEFYRTFSAMGNMRDDDGEVVHASLARAMYRVGNVIKLMRADVGYPFTSINEADVAEIVLRADDPGNILMLEILRSGKF